MPITRKHNFIFDTAILDNEISAEWEQIYSFLSGIISSSVILKQNTLNPCLILQNTGGNILSLFSKGSEVFQVLQNQQFKSLITLVAPIVVDSTTVITNLNAEYLDDFPLSQYILINLKHTENYINFYFQNAANQVVLAGDKCSSYIISEVINASLLEVKFKCKTGSGSDGATVSLRKNGVSLATAQLGSQTQFEGTFAFNVAVIEGDIITVTLDAITGNIEKLRARVKIKQDLVA